MTGKPKSARPPARPSRPPPPAAPARASVAPPRPSRPPPPSARSFPPPRPAARRESSQPSKPPQTAQTAQTAPPKSKPAPKPRTPKRRARDEAEEAREDAFVAAFGENVRTARLARKLTQAALAARARLSSNYVARLERGEVGASLWVAHCLALAMAMKLAELLDRERLVPPPPLLRR